MTCSAHRRRTRTHALGGPGGRLAGSSGGPAPIWPIQKLPGSLAPLSHTGWHWCCVGSRRPSSRRGARGHKDLKSSSHVAGARAQCCSSSEAAEQVAQAKWAKAPRGRTGVGSPPRDRPTVGCGRCGGQPCAMGGPIGCKRGPTLVTVRPRGQGEADAGAKRWRSTAAARAANAGRAQRPKAAPPRRKPGRRGPGGTHRVA
jgi:hypothetical protein